MHRFALALHLLIDQLSSKEMHLNIFIMLYAMRPLCKLLIQLNGVHVIGLVAIWRNASH